MKGTKALAVAAVALVAVAAAGCKGGNRYKIDWDMESVTGKGASVDSVTLAVEGETVASTRKLTKGHAFLSGRVEEPTLATLSFYYTLDGEPGCEQVNIILEPGDIYFNPAVGMPQGTALNDSVASLYSRLEDLMMMDAPWAWVVAEYVMNHNDDVSAAHVITNPILWELMGDSCIALFYDMTTERVRKGAEMVKLSERLDLIFSTAPGHEFVDFEAEWEGRTQRLSDYVGRGKLVVVDFWASWCAPCRSEIPGLIKLYKTYGGDDFEVVGVATWDKPEDTLKAIEELGIPYPQIMNAQREGSDAYGIEGIPEIILFAPDGTILERGLRGDAIEEAVKKYLGK